MSRFTVAAGETIVMDVTANDDTLPAAAEGLTVTGPFLSSEPEQPVEEEDLLLGIMSLLASVLFFNFARTAVMRITGRSYDQAFRSRLIRHITRHAMSGMGPGEIAPTRRSA